jgi:hypothetical protein
MAIWKKLEVNKMKENRNLILVLVVLAVVFVAGNFTNDTPATPTPATIDTPDEIAPQPLPSPGFIPPVETPIEIEPEPEPQPEPQPEPKPQPPRRGLFGRRNR